MVYISKLVLRNFRGVVKGNIELAPLTILIGPNNSGKTTVLEAIALAHGFRPVFGGVFLHDILSSIHTTYQSSGLDHLVYNYGAHMPRALVSFQTSTGETKTILIDVERADMNFYLIEKEMDPEQLLSLDREKLQQVGARIANVRRFTGEVGFLLMKVLADVAVIRPELMHRLQEFIYSAWTDIVNSGITPRVAEWISQVSSEDYLDITAEPFGGKPALYLYRGDRTRVRVGDVGDGVKVLVLSRILVEYLNPEIVLWDDVESHMNPRALMLLATWLAELSEKGKQVVVTTHSLEALRLIATVASESVSTAVLRLGLEKGVLKAEKLSVEEVEKLKELGIDVRV